MKRKKVNDGQTNYDFKEQDKKLKEKAKCTTCYGYGLWAVGNPCPMGPIDYADGCPNKKCPECGKGGSK